LIKTALVVCDRDADDRSLVAWRAHCGYVSCEETGCDQLTIAVLGAGLQGCCIALALVDRGVDVVLIERNNSVLSRTAIANEGKIHLGWMYAADQSLSTARTMMEGALAFAPFLERYLGVGIETLPTSIPAAYVVHRDSQHSVDEVRAYFANVHAAILNTSSGRSDAYFGRDLSVGPREWSADEVASVFDPVHAAAAFDSPEIAIDPLDLARRMSDVIARHPKIELRLGHEVVAASRDGAVTTRAAAGEKRENFDSVVNALWESRLAIDETVGLRAGRPWLYRLKYGVGFTWPAELPRPPSATFVSGPFGEVVSYADSTTYLTWYPSCVTEVSNDLRPPYWASNPAEPLRTNIIEGTVTALAAIVRALVPIKDRDLEGLWVKGGPIVAWGETDIDDPCSELHNRYEIGVHSTDRYHSVDPGKLTMAPFFAEECVSRILNR
jgi:glycine/D-amino acid oxidase-like deaminating enzyme